MQKLSLDQLERVDIETYKKQDKFPIKIILDNVRSMHNVGSTFRTADCLAVESVVLCGITATPPHREIEKTALGATASVQWEYQKDPIEYVRNLKQEGYKIIAVEQIKESTQLNDFKPKPNTKYALVFGNEVHGVQQEIVDMADIGLEIPQFGTKHSFNITVSIGIVVWDLVSKIHFTS